MALAATSDAHVMPYWSLFPPDADTDVAHEASARIHCSLNSSDFDLLSIFVRIGPCPILSKGAYLS